MNPTQHPHATCVIGAPKGWDQQTLPVGALAAAQVMLQGVPAIESIWIPTREELEALNRGGRVVLHVIGGNMPPVAIGVVA